MRPPKKRPFRSVRALMADGSVLNSINMRTASSAGLFGILSFFIFFLEKLWNKLKLKIILNLKKNISPQI